MKTKTRKLTSFRRRLADPQALWGIELAVTRRLTLDLTREQQALVRRATKHVVPSVTLVFTSNRLEPNGHALACLELRDSAKRAASQSRRRGRRAGR